MSHGSSGSFASGMRLLMTSWAIYLCVDVVMKVFFVGQGSRRVSINAHFE